MSPPATDFEGLLVRVAALTIGTVGMYLPYIALGLGLQAKGHEVTLATLTRFQSLITEYGLNHAALRGDYLEAARTPTRNPLKLIRHYQQELAARRSRMSGATPAMRTSWSTILLPRVALFCGQAGHTRLRSLSRTALFAHARISQCVLPRPEPGPLNRLSHRLFAKLGPVLFQRPINESRRDTLALPPAHGRRCYTIGPLPNCMLFAQPSYQCPPTGMNRRL